MIGVLCRQEDDAVFAEFFQLFKTPWEIYRAGHHYDVVLTTTGEAPECGARVVVIYSSQVTPYENATDVAAAGLRRGGIVRYRGGRLPIYGALLTFTEHIPATGCLATLDGAIVGLRLPRGHCTVVRLGYDLTSEVRTLLRTGQPVDHADVPTLDVHIALLRELIVDAGVSLVEIPPVPAGHPFAVCLTHDIDFAGIRYHRFDHTMWGFLYRATLGSLIRMWRGRLSPVQCAESWLAAVSLPFVYLGWVKDFWEPFAWYLQVEHGLPATYFLIPFKGRPGERVTAPGASRRGAAYDIDDVPDRAIAVQQHGGELGLHAIDAWHDVDRGRAERARITGVSCQARIGVRIHWLCRDEQTPRILEEGGFAWDASLGYNETVGYLNGTIQPFRPAGATTLLELPLHIQDGALFYPTRLNLTEPDAWARCALLVADAHRHGGALTVLWHDRSHAPERFWGDFYVRLLESLRTSGAWFATAGEVIDWFARRRAVRFERTGAGIRFSSEGGDITPPLRIRVHHPAAAGNPPRWVDVPWTGGEVPELPRVPAPTLPDAAVRRTASACV